MENFKDSGGNKSNNENELNPEMASRLKSPRKKQLPTKNFMNTTISAAIRASTPRKKILGERNEAEQNSLQRSFDFGSKSVKSSVIDSDDEVEKDSGVKPYDPVTNYLSPRPKFLRYNPNRRRNILNLQENDEDRVIISTYFNAGDGVTCSESQSGLESSVTQESVEETETLNLKNEEVEDEDEDEDEDGEEGETEEDRCCSLRGFFKVLFVVAALILTTQAICSMNSNSLSPSQTLEFGYGFNFSEAVEYGPIREPDLLVRRFEEGDAYDAYDDYERMAVDETVGESDVLIHDETLLEDEIKASEVMEIEDAEAEEDRKFSEDVLIEEDDDSDADQAKFEIAEDHEFNEDVLIEEDHDSYADEAKFAIAAEEEIKLTSFDLTDLTIAVITIHLLILTSIGVVIVYRSKYMKVGKEEIKDDEEEHTADLQSVKQHVEEKQSEISPPLQKKEEDPLVTFASSLIPPLQNDVSEQISHVHTPSVELLSEFVFGEEIASSENHSTDQTPAISSSQTTKHSHMEVSTADSVKKQVQRRRNAEIVPPSPVRRSSRLKTRSITSP